MNRFTTIAPNRIAPNVWGRKVHSNPARRREHRAYQQVVPPTGSENWECVGQNARKRFQIKGELAPEEEYGHLLLCDMHLTL
jgi:hypothetical protein